LLGSGIVLATVSAVALNLLFNGLGPSVGPEDQM
jgi:xanthine/uracil permease